MHELKCKNCKSPLNLAKAQHGVVECAYCLSTFTVPKEETNPAALDFLRTGEHELDGCAFDKAYTAFQKAAEYDSAEPQAYWGMALAACKVQYIKDVVNNRLQPVCHAVSDKPFTQNPDYEKALTLGTPAQRADYEKKGKEIDYVRSAFYTLERSNLDYDCFLCVKVTDDKSGARTADYKIADDIYFYLRGKGYKPFFSEREMQGRTGADYEALILYALYKADSMLVICSDERYLQTPWVKNEYTRFLNLIGDEEKESDSIALVFDGAPIEKLPGKSGKLQGIDIRALDAMEKTVAFVQNHMPETRRKKASEEERQRKLLEALAEQAAAVKYCAACGAKNAQNVKFCGECGGSAFVDTFEQYRERLTSAIRKEEEEKARLEAAATSEGFSGIVQKVRTVAQNTAKEVADGVSNAITSVRDSVRKAVGVKPKTPVTVKRDAEFKGKTVEDAVNRGLFVLGKKREEVEVRVLFKGGKIRKAKVRILYTETVYR